MRATLKSLPFIQIIVAKRTLAPCEIQYRIAGSGSLCWTRLQRLGFSTGLTPRLHLNGSDVQF